MATAIEAPATITAEGPTSHTLNQFDALVSRLEAALQRQADTAGTYGYTRAEQIEALHRLREPFPPSEVRYRPQPWCKACTNTQGWPKVCQHHTEIRCQRCNNQKITDAHICLRYIGHAEATNRLLNVDPFWSWEPLALDQVGLPQYDGNRGMWIRLTVCGVTRIGYGDAAGKDGGNAVKEIIGDAIRNAGMRFGMALNLWTSSDLEILEPGVPLAPELAAELGAPSAEPATQQPPRERPNPPKALSPEEQEWAEFQPKVKRSWNSLTAMQQNLAEARAKNLTNLIVPVGPDNVPTRLEDLLTERIAQLTPPPSGRNAESASAA
jgi:hypothetical protein